MKQLTSIMRIHNEEKFLPYTLNSFFKVNSEYYLFIFDRCIDKSFDIIINYSKKINKFNKCRFLAINNPSKHSFRMCYLMEIIIKKCNTKYILYSSADLILDYKLINSKIRLLNNYGIISFAVKPYNFGEIINYLFDKIKSSFHGTFIFDKSLIDNTIFKKLKSSYAEDTTVYNFIKKKKQVICFNSNNIHLRKDTLKEFINKKFNRLYRKIIK